MADGFDALTTKEKDVLRLMGRGHDAKSMARHLGVSVHTVNERLRVARRKLSVTSSREAARLLLEREGMPPQNFVHTSLGDAEAGEPVAGGKPSQDGGPARRRSAPIIAGAFLMSVLLALMLFTSPAQGPGATPTAPAPVRAPDPAVVDTARAWLALVDAGRWDASYRATSASFQKTNTLAAWTAASEGGRVPLGAIRSREILDQRSLPAPPRGYEVLTFRTSFANKPAATETLSFERDGSAWRVVGYIIE